ncbi:MAG: hypothetical protein IIX01_01430, partial [Clostridia bacterium]|nr:hypothetical protein [Clostridia bacterium]
DPTSLTSSDKAKEDKYALPESEKEFLGRKFLKDIVWKALPAILFGLYGVKEVAQLSWAAFAWTVFQAFTGFASALAEMITSKHYIVNEVRTGMVKKIGWIDDFYSDLTKNPDEYKKRLKKETDNECVQKEKQDPRMAECVG